jgi:hypothetical protein
MAMKLDNLCHWCEWIGICTEVRPDGDSVALWDRQDLHHAPFMVITGEMARSHRGDILKKMIRNRLKEHRVRHAHELAGDVFRFATPGVKISDIVHVQSDLKMIIDELQLENNRWRGRFQCKCDELVAERRKVSDLTNRLADATRNQNQFVILDGDPDKLVAELSKQLSPETRIDPRSSEVAKLPDYNFRRDPVIVCQSQYDPEED